MKAAKLIYIGAVCFAAASIATSRADSDKSVTAAQVNGTWKTEGGETKEDTTFVDITAFARTAEVIAQYYKKGRPILIEGRLKFDQWDDKQTGQKRSRLGIVLEAFQFLDSGRGDGAGGGSRQAAAPPASPSAPPSAEAPGSEGPAPEEDDVPF